MVSAIHPRPEIGQHLSLLRGCELCVTKLQVTLVPISFVMDRATLKQELEKVIAVGPGISRHLVTLVTVMLSNLSNIMSETMTKIHDAEDENVDGEKGGFKMTKSYDNSKDPQLIKTK